MDILLPILLFALCATFLGVGVLALGMLLGPKRNSRVKEMPYESGMDPIHDARRRFDVRFHVVAIAFLLFDVELLFLYPWAVASRNPEGMAKTAAEAGNQGLAASATDYRLLVFGGVLAFITLLALGLVYEWRKGVLKWR